MIYSIRLIICLALFTSGCSYQHQPDKLSNPYNTSFYRNSYQGYQERIKNQISSCYSLYSSDKTSAQNCVNGVGGGSFTDFIMNNQFDSNN